MTNRANTVAILLVTDGFSEYFTPSGPAPVISLALLCAQPKEY